VYKVESRQVTPYNSVISNDVGMAGRLAVSSNHVAVAVLDPVCLGHQFRFADRQTMMLFAEMDGCVRVCVRKGTDVIAMPRPQLLRLAIRRGRRSVVAIVCETAA